MKRENGMKENRGLSPIVLMRIPKQLLFMCFLLSLVGCTNGLNKSMRIDVEGVHSERSENTPEMLLLKRMQGIFLSPPKSGEDIAVAFGWNVSRETESEVSRVSTFDPRNGGAVSMAKLYFHKKVNRTTLDISFVDAPGFCVSAESVTSMFGKSFERMIKSIDHGMNDSKVLNVSESVKKNRTLFADGPLYNIDNPVSASLSFSFNYRECASSASVTHPKY